MVKMTKIKNKRFIISILLIVLFVLPSCSKGNPINGAIQRITNIFVAKQDKVIEPSVNTGEMMLLTQNEEKEGTTEETKSDTSISIIDSLMSDSTKGLPFTVETYTYKTKYERDPFISILELQRDRQSQIDIESASYYGMLKGKNGKMALLKDASRMGFVFFEGEKIKNGLLLKVEADSVIFKLDEYGVVRNKVIRLNKKISKKSKK
ncbi:MAG: hypothetical protein COX48_03740 [bacterium (Candidatus Stahlbacteria) CG23_combo_of_CG06-09_8_20_14_all_34_7]|nr:MAG: hypothetical protein COX48_03740 [bacterium (Candidatus Stahlbacteria) CG23_combo_of_CG06-09_8_20_14_all_34_7]